MSRPTLSDVARAAGVSLKTASRAINGEYGVAEATGKRVREAARTLGFRPNRLARSLAAGQRSAAVGLVLPSVSDPFIAELVGAVESVLAPRDLQLVTASHDDDPDRQRRIVATLVERRVDALIIVPAPGPAAYLQSEIDHGLVVVALDRPLDEVGVDVVTVDNVGGARTAVATLVERGHRRIAFLGSDPRISTQRRRYVGYAEALTTRGLHVDPDLTDMTCARRGDAERVTQRMLEAAEPPTAVFAGQHLAGRGALRAMRRAGVDLDMAVFDEVADTDLLAAPPVIVVTSGPDRLGALGARMAGERLDGLDAAPRTVTLPPLILNRGTHYRPQVDLRRFTPVDTPAVPAM